MTFRQLLWLLMMASCATQVSAEDFFDEDNQPPSDFLGTFLTGDVGVGGMRTPASTVVNSQTISSSESRGYGFVMHVAAGYLWHHDQPWSYGFQLGYESYPDNTYSYAAHYTVSSSTYTRSASLAYKAHEYPVLGVLKYRFSGNWVVNAYAGLSYVMQENHFSYSDSGASASSPSNVEVVNRFQPEMGVGIEYRYEHYGFGCSVRYRFGTTPTAFSVPSDPTVPKRYYDGYNKIPATLNFTLGVSYYIS